MNVCFRARSGLLNREMSANDRTSDQDRQLHLRRVTDKLGPTMSASKRLGVRRV